MPSEKRSAVAEFEGDLLAVLRHVPRFRQFRFEVLGVAIRAHQHATGQIANGNRSIVIDQQRIEGLRLGMQAEAQFTAVLGEGRAGS